ncbi:MAG TPA: hypothetical protein VIS48_01385 [Candidatus Kryptonia bacterium]
MGKRFGWFVFPLMFIAGGRLLAQDSIATGSFLDRLSVSLTGSYHYAPWKGFNNSLTVLESEIEFDPLYQQTSGWCKQGIGDGASQAKVYFSMTNGIDLVATGAMLQSTASDNLVNYFEQTYDIGEFTNESTIFRLRSYSVGVGVRYHLNITEGVSIICEAFGERAFGRLHFEYAGTNSYFNFVASADMSANTWGGVASVGVRARLYGPISLLSSVDYRYLKFRDFEGSGNYLFKLHNWGLPTVTADSLVSPVKLIEADPYFGVHFINTHATPYSSRYVPYYHTNYYDDIPGPETPAILDLSGFGLSIGVEYEF